MPRDDNRRIFLVPFTDEKSRNIAELRKVIGEIFVAINKSGSRHKRGEFDTSPPIMAYGEGNAFTLLAEVKSIDGIGFNRRLF